MESYYGCVDGRRCKLCSHDYHVNAKHLDGYHCERCLLMQETKKRQEKKATAGETEVSTAVEGRAVGEEGGVGGV